MKSAALHPGQAVGDFCTFKGNQKLNLFLSLLSVRGRATLNLVVVKIQIFDGWNKLVFLFYSLFYSKD